MRTRVQLLVNFQEIIDLVPFNIKMATPANPLQ